MTVQALNNYDDSGATVQTARRARASAEATGGGLVDVRSSNGVSQHSTPRSARVWGITPRLLPAPRMICRCWRNRGTMGRATADGTGGGLVSVGTNEATSTIITRAVPLPAAV